MLRFTWHSIHCHCTSASTPDLSSAPAEYLSYLGVDIEKPFETMPLEPDAEGYIEYICSQYIVCGESNDFVKTDIDSVTIDVTDVHPSVQMEQEHFVIELYPIRLKWTM